LTHEVRLAVPAGPRRLNSLERKHEVFAALVETRSRVATAEQLVWLIEQEGLEVQWPPSVTP
jgi:hypothetical protein